MQTKTRNPLHYALISFLLILFGVMVGQNVTAQINIENGKERTVGCLGELTILSFSTDSSFLPVSWEWDFGDKSTSTHVTPVHLYKQSGIFTIKVKATSIDGDVLVDSAVYKVLSSPRASFDYLSSSDTCSYASRVCFVNKSEPAEKSRPIVARRFVWGDGSNVSFPASNDTICHQYSSAGTFNAYMEVEDVLGCAAGVSRKVHIVPGVEAKLSYNVQYANCTTATLCVQNASLFQQGSNVRFRWKFDGISSTSGHFFNNPLCFSIDSSQTKDISLSVIADNGCFDTISAHIPVEVYGDDYKIELTAKEMCYTDQPIRMSVRTTGREHVTWYFNGEKADTGSYIYLRKGYNRLPPGLYTIRCQMVTPTCTRNLYEQVEIHGPIAKMQLFNEQQCSTTNRVFFIQESEYVDEQNSTFKWVVNDPYGKACVINRAKGINKYQNCDTTIGFFGKHDFSELRSYYLVELEVTDQKTGCASKAYRYVNLLNCKIGGCGGTFSVCKGNELSTSFLSYTKAYKYSLDSGRTWRYANGTVNAPPGNYEIGIIQQLVTKDRAIDYGDDSIKIYPGGDVFYDTIFCGMRLIVNATDWEKLTFDLSEGCLPEATVKLENGQFSAGDFVWVSWGDKTEYIQVKSDTVIKELTHKFLSPRIYPGLSEVRVLITRNGGCLSVDQRFNYSYGYTASISRTFPCLGDTLKAWANVRDNKTGQMWDEQNGLGTVRWLVNGKLWSEDKFHITVPMDSIGHYWVTLITESTDGCIDTSYSVQHSVYDVVAGFKDLSRRPYCKGTRQFFDSSKVIHNGLLQEPVYLKNKWFVGTAQSSVRDPYFVFDGTEKEVPVTMIASYGYCRDTVHFKVRVLRSAPEFTIKDPVMCAPATMTFTNNSVGANHFVWEFGDSNNFTKEVFDNNEVTYTYTKPGTYYTRLIAIDQDYDPFVGTTVYCPTIYPNAYQDGVELVVLPSKHKGLTGPDTLCVNQPGKFIDLDRQLFDKTGWNLGDGTMYEEVFEDTIIHSYDAPGRYMVSLEPYYLGHSVTPECISAVEKEVVVIDVIADFSIDPLGDETYEFINGSDPINASYYWDFGHPVSGDLNFSNERDPIHSYAPYTGEYVICLVASSNGCLDTVCKPIKVGLESFIETYNVFTPGDEDGYNDRFEVTMKNVSSYDYTIYNRWGEIVLEKRGGEHYKKALLWNGRVNNVGVNCPAGTYFYILKYALKSNPKKFELVEGTITLIR